MEEALFGEGPRRNLGGRSSECALLDDLVTAVRCGDSQSLVLRGEAGIGKTALLEYLLDSASDLTVLRATGIESEMEFALRGTRHSSRTAQILPLLSLRGSRSEEINRRCGRCSISAAPL